MIQKLLKTILGTSQEDRQAELYRNLIRHEAKIGGTLFGPVPNGGRREFFCLDERTWIWHEEWTDEQGVRRTKTTRYDVRPNGILKAQDGNQYQYVSKDEARHLRDAAQLYRQRVKAEIYNRVR
ncbi:hypothetical protein EKI60_00140 [Candidatus Saccharibacteria bacterium]|nr:MAG: hypothetical protein EKI60_00140 [Candidatus Saccharibacteria bacterium]